MEANLMKIRDNTLELMNKGWNKITANVPPYLRPLVIPVYTEVLLLIGSLIYLVLKFSWKHLIILLLLQILMILAIINIFEKATGEKITWK
jgi:hypothetical protein